MGLGPIPWTAMHEWCEFHSLHRHIAEHLIHVLRLIDQETLRREAVRQRNAAASRS